jgi:DNA primase
MGIAADDIEKVRSALSIVDVIQPYVALRKVGGNWVGLCPFHAEKTGSFNVRETTGRYKCFGCDAGGDVFTFVQEIEHVDFAAAVERLASKAGIQLTYTTGGEGRERQQRSRLVEALNTAVEWYHDRLLTAPDARMARDYLRSRGLAGEVARRHKLGWAPDDWDTLSRESGLPADALQKTGLAFVNKRNRLQDAFRGRVLFPIFTADGDPVAFGGRILPGSTDPAKYKNSPETAIYAKSKTLYGLNWAKADVVASNQVIVCEGYTDVIGFHRSGVPRAVATCGTALTEDHVRLLKRYASRVVLAFDADAAGQGAADRFYEWEQKYQVEVSVARFPDGRDPGDLASSDPDALRQAVERAEPFLGFRVHRVLAGRPPSSPEARARLANQAMAVINEHPDDNVRRLYAGEVASHTGLSAADLLRIANQKGGRVVARDQPARRSLGESAEFVALALLIQRWDDIAPWLVEPLFADDLQLRAFRALANGGGDLDAALAAADPEARAVIERAAVADVEQDPEAEVRNLIRAAVRRELAGARSLEQAAEWSEVRRLVEQLEDPISGPDAADRLLQWLGRRSEERS